MLEKNVKIFVLVIASVLAINLPIFAEFEPWEAGCRNIGMGGALLTGRGIDAFGSNPAGFSQSNAIKLLLNGHDMYGLGISQSFFGVSTRVRDLGLGLSFNRVADDSFPYKEQTFQLSVGKQLNAKLATGTAIRFGALSSLGGEGKALAADFGLILQLNSNVELAVLAENGLAFARYDNGDDERPPLAVKIGGTISLPGQTLFAIQVPTMDLSAGKLHLGLEKWFSKQAAARLGLRNGHLTAGLSLETGNYALDYAYTPHKLGDTHRLALRITLGREGR